MDLPPHLHLLIPSSTPSILLEVRLYLPSSCDSSDLKSSAAYTTESSGSPVPFSQLPGNEFVALKQCGAITLITAAHPWATLGGNQLDPVITSQLLSAVYATNPNIVVLSYNQRGVGASGGVAGWMPFATKVLVDDFSSVERWGLEVLGRVENVWRLGYSFGSIPAINAPHPPIHKITKTILVSPALTLFALATFFSSRTLRAGISATVSTTDNNRLWIVYGSKDQFTGSSAYATLVKENQGLVVKEVIGADHFYRSAEHGGMLEGVMKEWIGA